MTEAPPRPPPHGAKSSGLPNGNYDVFIIPPHSAGSGFLYLPSLKPNINSFIAGFFTALLCVGFWNILIPALRNTVASLNSGVGALLLIAAVGAAFTFGRTTMDGGAESSSKPGTGGMPNFTFNSSANFSAAGSKPTDSSATDGWEKAREETRRREAERKKAEELKAGAEAATKRKEEAEKAARAAAEKDRWEQARAREKDAREREARERMAKERAAKIGAKYQKPTAQSATDSDYFTQYKHAYADSASAASEESASSYAPSASTARTTPPPRDRGPYTTSDPNKIMIEGVFLYTSGFPKPVAMLQKNRDGLTDGLILRITTEGLFIDDDVRGVPQREWDVKAWGIKLLEHGNIDGVTVLRATMRDAEGKRYLFVLPAEQTWKVDVGSERLVKGSQARSVGRNKISDREIKGILSSLGWH